MSSVVRLPFFPLGLVAFPGEVVNLHIFEPRYRQLFAELESSDTTFVMVPHLESRLKSCGTELRLVGVAKRYESGELDVRVEGLGVVEVSSYQDPLPDKLYAGGDVTRLAYDLESGDAGQAQLLRERSADLLLTLRAHTELPVSDAPGFSFRLGHKVGLTTLEEYRLLTLPTEAERQAYLLKAVERSIRTVKATEAMRHKVQMNGHFRYIPS